MKELGIKIHELKEKGYTYDGIHKELSCSKSTVSYYLGQDQKLKSKLRLQKRRSKPESVLIEKIYRFRWRDNKKVMGKIRDFQRRDPLINNRHKLINQQEKNFTVDEFLKKIGNNPKCYLSGEPIDLYNPESYSLDHIIPSSKDGNNTLDNAELISFSVNKMKDNLSITEFLEKCVQILKYNGYEVIKK
jgi:predicted transcriptional regulator